MGTSVSGRSVSSPVASIRPNRRRVGAIATTISVNVILVVLSAFCLLPFWLILTGGFKPLGDVFLFPPRLLPTQFTLEAYEKLFWFIPFSRNILNSVYISSTYTFGALLSSAIAAFAFARMRFPGREFFFMLFLSTMMIPGIVYLIPQFMIFKFLGWTNSPLPLIVPGFFTNAFAIFMLRQFFQTLPAELEEAAKIDGASWPQILFYVSLPNIAPALATLGLFLFIGSWNDLLGPIIYLNKLEDLNLMAAMAALRSQYAHSGEHQNIEMAAGTIAILPLLILFAFTQRYITRTFVFSGIKG